MTKVKKNYRSKKCLNCLHPLDISDKFCSNCGQKNTTSKLSFNVFLHEFFSNFYAYDSKLKKSIYALIFKPGIAALEYVNGKRASYANPFRLYFSISLVFFILLSLITKFEVKDPNDKLKDLRLNNTIDSITNTDTIKTNFIYLKEKDINNLSIFSRTIEKINTFKEFHTRNPNLSIAQSLDSLNYSQTKINTFLFKKTKEGQDFSSDFTGNFKKFKNYIIGNLPIILFLSIPLLTIIFSLIYIRKKQTYAEHLVYVFSLMSFIFLMLLINTITVLLFGFDLSGILSLLFFYYFYRSLRNFYHQSRWKTILKFVILNILLPITSFFVAFFLIIIAFIFY